MLGEEFFYIISLPLAAWVVNAQFAVHLTVLLAMSVGLGNILKNFCLIPRPPHPPVWCHVSHETDHGLPSTHTMTAITIPWYFIIFHTWLQPATALPTYIYIVGVLWSTSVMMSRVYNGHHTPMDVIAGAVLGTGFLMFFTWYLRPVVDSLAVSGNLTGILTVVGTTVSALALHPVPPKVPTPAYAETGLVAGTTTGAFLGLWTKNLNNPRSIYQAYQAFFNMDAPYPPHFAISDHLVLVYFFRIVIGVTLVIMARMVVKKLGMVLIMQIARMLNKKYASKTAFKYSEGDVAVKYITYSAVGFTATFVVGIACMLVGLHLPLDDEILSRV